MAAQTPVEKKPYEVTRPFWHGGLWRVEGEVLSLAEAEAKYLGDNLRRKIPAPAPEPQG